MKFESVTFQMKATLQSITLLWYTVKEKVVLRFESTDEILESDH